ncbi:MAG: hypothetical protein RLZZ440_2536 [Planctomycetota bacterium]
MNTSGATLPVRRGMWLLCLAVLGCSQTPPPGGRPSKDETVAAAGARPVPQAAATKGMREQLLAGMVAILSELERYDEVRAAEQVFDRLVQWSHAAREGAWQPDPLLGTLTSPLRESAAAVLERPTFDGSGDIQAVRDRIWLAAIVRTAGGDGLDEVEAATRLFAWTIRWLAAVSDPPMVPTEAVPGSRWFFPGEILLAGRGSPAQRAWIFLELLNQAGIDGVMLATPGPAGGPPRPWVPAAIIGGEAYLFEPTYGQPIAGPDGDGIATVRQAAADPGILAALSLPDRPYPVQANDLGRLVVLVPGDAWSLSARMARLNAELAPAHGVRVAVEASTLAARALAAIPGANEGEPQLWTFPWETLARRELAGAALADEIGPLTVPLPSDDPRQSGQAVRPLFAGRVREFRGELEGPAGAKAAYLAARPSRRAISQAVAGLPEPQAAAVTRGLVRMKEDATYWLGLLTLSEGQDQAAADYLGRMTLEAAPDSRWTDAARVNLAAALEGLGRLQEAAVALEADGSPQRFGSRLRAAKLLAKAATMQPEAPPPAALSEPAED